MDAKNEITSYIGVRIFEHRKAMDMSQGQLAACVGLTRASISNIEGGFQETTVTKLYEIAATLNVTIYALLPDDRDNARVTETRKHAREKLRQKELDKVNKEIERLLERQNRLST